MPTYRWDPRWHPPRNLVRPVPVDPLGIDGPTRHEVRSPGWRSTSYGLHVPPGTPTDVPRALTLLPALDLASDHSRSPRETALRLICVLDVDAGQAIEFDGAEHRGAVRHTRDVAKDEAFRGRGLEVTRVTGTDLRDRDLVVRRVVAARSRAAWASPGTRLWVPRPPRDDLHERLVEREERARLHEQMERDASAPE